MSDQGDRHNAGKNRLDLVPVELIHGCGRAMTFGANKYAAWNWLRGLSWSETYGSLQRHLTAWFQGEELDPESGLSHLDHAAANVAFLLAFQAQQKGTDDRPEVLPATEPEPTDQQVFIVDLTWDPTHIRETIQDALRAGGRITYLLPPNRE